MADMLLLDSLKELRTLIDQQHLLYLEFDENPRKIDQRDKLESYIRDYLYLAPHDTKFTFQQTADVLHQSARNKNFSAYKAAVAWKAIGKYADNLISHPWRKEYRDIKLYCGFYKHEVEEGLVGAELMFEAMGYRSIGQSCMTLPGILDPDRITSVSKDAIVAFVECQIIKHIWENLSSHYNISWLEILEFRENHTGTPDHVIRALTYKYRQRQYQEQMYSRLQPIQSYSNHLPHTECPYEQHSLGYYNHTQYPGHSYSLPAQSRYAAVVNSQQIVPSTIYPSTVHPSYASHHILKPQDVYPVNGYQVHSSYSSPMGLQHPPLNGFSMVPVMYAAPSVVPTGQLIELDSSPAHNGSGSYLPQSSHAKCNLSSEESGHYHSSIKNDGPSLTGKARDDGAGSWENWDYVYRNLESQGYKKDFFESPSDGILKGNQQSSSHNNSSDMDSIIQTEISDKVRKMNVDGSNQGRTESCERSSNKGRFDADNEVKSKTVKEKSKNEVQKTKEHSKTKGLKTSPEKTRKETLRKNSDVSSSSNGVSGVGSVIPKKENESQGKENLKSKKSRDEPESPAGNLNDTEEKWQCVTCTYLNSYSTNVCEMCYKSKHRGSELNPQPSGGQECPKCTLVNEPGLNFCSACSTSLKDSPTYI